jgi:hypothetical protein
MVSEPGRQKDPNRRFQILSLLDGTHGHPETGYWSAQFISSTFGISLHTALHALARLRNYNLVVSSEVGERIEVRRPLKNGSILVGGIPKKTLAWTLTEKGRERLKYVGGHEKYCPLCKKPAQ